MATNAQRRTKASFDKAAKRIEKLSRNLSKAVPSGLRIIGEEVMFDVKSSTPDRGVPVDEGTLRSTGRVEGPRHGAVELSFGGAAAPYALEQHENTALRHTVGEARYLVRGLERWQQNGRSVRQALARLRAEVTKLEMQKGW